MGPVSYGRKWSNCGVLAVFFFKIRVTKNFLIKVFIETLWANNYVKPRKVIAQTIELVLLKVLKIE